MEFIHVMQSWFYSITPVTWSSINHSNMLIVLKKRLLLSMLKTAELTNIFDMFIGK